MNKDCVQHQHDHDHVAIYAKAYMHVMSVTGGPTKAGELVDRCRQAVSKWRGRGIPWDQSLALEDKTGVPAYKSNPVIYPKERILAWAEQIRSER